MNLSNFAHLLTLEGGSAHEGVGIIEKSLFHPDYELLETSMPYAGIACDMAHSEEVVVISGTIKISP